MSEKQQQLQSSDYFTPEMSTKVDDASAAYYHVADGVRPSKAAYCYQPSDDDYILDRDNKNWQRLIFPEGGPYLEYEEEIFEELEEYVHENNIIVPSFVDKRAWIRFLQANHYKIGKTVEDLLSHLTWRKETLPICLSTMQKRFLDKGLFYIHGRDKNFRPLNVFDPRVLIGVTADRDEVLMVVHFVLQFIIDNMLVPGKVDNWVGLMDLSGLSISQLPKKWLNDFIKSCQSNYKCRGVKSFLLGASWGVRAVWSIAQAFVDSKVKQKLVFHGSPKCDELIGMFHPSQIEEKFGGTAKNLDVFWPPKEVSNEYGEDPDKILIQSDASEHDIADLSDDDEEMSIAGMEEHSPVILSQNIEFNNKLNPKKKAAIKQGQIEFESKSVHYEGKFDTSRPEFSKYLDSCTSPFLLCLLKIFEYLLLNLVETCHN